MENRKKTELFVMAQEGGCGCGGNAAAATEGNTAAETTTKKVLDVVLLVIDLTTCARCVPTGDQLQQAVNLLMPVAEALGIALRHRQIVVQTPQEAKQNALLSSPTIRLNGRDIEQDIRESLCESCGDLTENNTMVDCREWHYRGKVYSAAPLPLRICQRHVSVSHMANSGLTRFTLSNSP